MRFSTLILLTAGISLASLPALAQTDPSVPPVNNGHRQPTRASVTEADQADNVSTKRNANQLDQIEKENVRMKRLMGSICSNCGN